MELSIDPDLIVRKPQLMPIKKKKVIHKNKFKLYNKPSFVDIYAILINNNNGKYVNNNTYFYELLNSLYEQYLKKISSDYKIKQHQKPFTEHKFSFKPHSETIYYFNNGGERVTENMCRNKKCIFTLKIIPYFIKKKGTIGISIKVKSIQMIN